MRESIAVYAFSMGIALHFVDDFAVDSIWGLLALNVLSVALVAYAFAIFKKDGYGR